MSSASSADASSAARQRRARALASAELALSLAELLRTGALLPDVLAAIAGRRRQRGDPLAPRFERMARAVRDEGQSLFQAVEREKQLFTPRFLAFLALANLSGQVFRACVARLRGFVRRFNSLPPDQTDDFPLMRDEVQEFCHLFGHLTREKTSQTEIQKWLPRVFTPKLTLPVTLVLARFYGQGLLLSEAFQKTPPFDDAEMVLAVQAGEELNRVGDELIELAEWLEQRHLLNERMRWNDLVLSRQDLPGTSPLP